MRQFLVLLALCGGVAQSDAQPEMIFDNGETLSIRPYLGAVSIQSSRTRRQPSLSPSEPLSAIRLPVRTPELAPGKLGKIALSAELADRLKQLPRPLFLLGTDSLSRQWLSRYRAQLIELKAVGMLVDVESDDQLRAAQQLGEGLVIAPASASELAKVLGVRHYPVLITRDGVEQ